MPSSGEKEMRAALYRDILAVIPIVFPAVLMYNESGFLHSVNSSRRKNAKAAFSAMFVPAGLA